MLVITSWFWKLSFHLFIGFCCWGEVGYQLLITFYSQKLSFHFYCYLDSVMKFYCYVNKHLFLLCVLLWIFRTSWTWKIMSSKCSGKLSVIIQLPFCETLNKQVLHFILLSTYFNLYLIPSILFSLSYILGTFFRYTL